MEIINYTEARKNLSKVLDKVSDDQNYTVIHRRDKPDAVVMSLNHFNSMMETMHLLSSPANAAHLAQSIAEYQKGQAIEHPLIDD